MNGQQPFGVALFGYGYAGKTFHAPLVASVQGLKLMLVISSNKDKVSADWPDVAVSSDCNAALQNEQMDLIVIATPNDTHFELASRALEAGKHVIVDKPFTTTVQEAQCLIEIAKRKGKLLSVFHNRRWDADFLTVKRLLSEGQLGEVMYLESHIDRYRPNVLPRWREQPGEGTGLWYDLGPHLVDQVLLLFGPPDSIQTDLAVQRPGALTTDYFHAQLKYGQKRAILHSSCLVAAETPRFILHGTKGSFIKYGVDVQEEALKRNERPGGESWGRDPRDGILTIWDQDYAADRAPRKVSSTIPVACGSGDYTNYYRAIEAAIRHGAPNPVPADEALSVMKILVAND
jgi:predicted dehydrogenase